ncbi:hypothetical protein DENSPDRAFT_762586, partial [Dentipellis sp. KUC8613]
SSEVYRGRLFRRPDSELDGEDVVCKVAYRPQAVSCLEHEAEMFFGKLQHLQGVCIPICYGYFEHKERMDWRSCLVLDYRGEPVKSPLAKLDVDFKALLHAVTHLHDAGVTHGDLWEENILDYQGLPMIIDLETAAEHKCERQLDMVEGAPAPSSHDFKCNELYQFCQNLEYWKPG